MKNNLVFLGGRWFCFTEIGNIDRRNKFTEGKITFNHVEFETDTQLEMANEH